MPNNAHQVATWDWTLALEEEFRLVKRCGRSLAILAYFVARATAVMLCILSLVFLTNVPPGKPVYVYEIMCIRN